MTRREGQAWVVAGGALGAVLAGWALQPGRFPHAWLSAFAAFSLWPLGSLALLYAHALTGGRWGEEVRPGLLAGAGLAPLLGVLVVPIVLTLPALYPWARPEGAALPNRAWLDPGFVLVRGALSVGLWTALAWIASRRRDLARIAPYALLGLAVSVTVEAIDLTMSLDPRFVSSAYGMIAGASAVVMALACAILVNAASGAGGGGAEDGQVGKLLLALVCLWTYLDFMQIVIVYQSDLVTQSPWYGARARGAAGWAMAAISLLHSVIPFFALLSPSLRRSRAGLGAVAALLIAAEILRAYWTVLPASPRGPGLLDAACVVFIVALGSAWALRRRAC